MFERAQCTNVPPVGGKTRSRFHETIDADLATGDRGGKNIMPEIERPLRVVGTVAPENLP
jgi:hypothetical protein